MLYGFTRLSILKFFIFNKKRAKKTLLIINFSIFLTIFAASAAIISLYTENKIAEKEFELNEVLRTQNQLHNYRTMFPVLHKSIDTSIMFDRIVNRFNLFIDGTNFGDQIMSEREFYFYRAHALIGPMYDLFEDEMVVMIEETKELLPQFYDEEYVDALTNNGEFYKKFYVLKKKYELFKKNTKEFEQYDVLSKYQLLKETISEEHVEAYDKYEDYYDLAYDLNLYSIKFLELWETVYLDLAEGNKSDITIFNQTIKKLSKTESQLILFAFFLQLLIFLVIQFFEISSVAGDKRGNK